jgi:hypothetical protein
MSDPDNSATDREAPPSDRKSILELRKLELEIAHLTRPFWQSTTFLSLVIAFAGLFVGFYTGFFDKQKVLLDITKANLERDVKNLDAEKLRVTVDIARLKATFLQELTVTTEREVEIFLLKDLDAVLHGNTWLHREGHLSAAAGKARPASDAVWREQRLALIHTTMTIRQIVERDRQAMRC